jgi:hypothetical protein
MPLTVAEARAAFSSTWSPFASGFACGNPLLLYEYASPKMVDAIIGWFNCGCGPWPASLTDVRLSVPPQTQYPLQFLAELSGKVPVIRHTGYHGQALTREVVFTKTSASTPWLVTYMIGYDGASTYLAASSVQSPAPVPFDITIVGGQFAAYFQSMVNTGVPPPDNNWPATGSVKDELNRYDGVVQAIDASGEAQQMTFAASEHSTAFAMPGGDIMCGDFTSKQTVTSPSGQPISQSRKGQPWGPLLIPGSYSSVTKLGVHDYCFTTTTDGLTTPISFFGGVYEIDGH